MLFEDPGVADLSSSLDSHSRSCSILSIRFARLNRPVVDLYRVKLESTALIFIPAHPVAPAFRSS